MPDHLTLNSRLPVPFALGAMIRTPARTITDAEFSAVINASWENGPLHTDAEYMKDTVFGRPILGGPCLLAVSAGLTSNALYGSWSAAGLDCYAALGIDEVRYDAPVFAGDTIHVETVVSELNPTPRGSAWKCAIDDTVRNQDDASVLRMRRSYLLKPLRADQR